MSADNDLPNDLTLGINALDEQHRQLLMALRDLEAMCDELANEQGSERLLAQGTLLVAQLQRHLEIHDAVEDALMQIVAPPGRDEHRAFHSEVASKLVGFHFHVYQGNVRGISKADVTALRSAVIQHIERDDRKVIEYLKKCSAYIGELVLSSSGIAAA